MRQPVRFGSGSLAAAGATVLLVEAFHPLLVVPLQAAETAAWLAVLLAGLFALVLHWPVAAQLARLPGGNLMDLARRAAGVPGAIGTGLLVCGLLTYHSGLVVRKTAEMAVSSVYPHTPATFATVALLLCTGYGAWGGRAGLVRLCRSFMPLLAGAIVVILVGSAGWGSIGYLLPFWGPGPGLLLVRSAGLAYMFAPTLLYVLVTAGPVQDRPRLWRAGALCLAGGALLFALAEAVALKTYPLPLGSSVYYLLHRLARLTVGGRFFERIEAIWVLFWVFGTGCHLAAMIQAAATAYAQAFSLQSHRDAVLPLLALMATVGLFPRDIVQTSNWQYASAPFYWGIGLALPLALALLAAGRRRWRRRAG